ncbi:MAG: heparinase II/III family protein [Armatimonadetes bacterium]|nr:heparinase II/III family protein [Armatimonadota bacterium]
MIILTLILLPLTCISVSAQPSLWFTKADLASLRARVESDPHRDRWNAILSQARGYCTPGGSFADPESIDKDAGDPKRPQVLGHYFGRKLTDWTESIGFAYQLTGDEALGRHGAAIMEAACRLIPVTHPGVAQSFAGARGDIAHGLAVGYDWLGEALSPEQKALWADTAAGYVENILAEAHKDGTWWVPHHNFVGVAVGAAGCLALQLRAYRPEQAQGWVDDCAELISRWLDQGFDDQGAYFEGTLYAVYGLSNATLFADALLRSGGPDLFPHPKLKRVSHYLAMSLLPGERVFDARNDANYAGLSDPVILRLAGAHDDGLARWLWEYCGGGNSPFAVIWDNEVEPLTPAQAGEPPAEHFLGRGLCVFRTGWDKDDVMFAIEAGPYYKVTHNQADKGHITLYGLGERWAIDSGYGNNRQPGGRDQTVAHNCVLIDGEGQAISGAGAGTNGKIVAYSNSAEFGYALADATEAYNRNNHGQPGATVEHALRHALFIRPGHGAPAYSVVFDDIVKDDAAHEFTWLLHSGPNIDVKLRESGALLVPLSASGDGFVETPAAEAGRGHVTWEFEVKQGGEYAVWARVRAAGEEAGKSDSFLVSVDGGAPVDWHMPSARDWTWGRVSKGIRFEKVTYTLNPGTHSLRFATREPGAQVDRIIVTAASREALTLEQLDSEIGFEAESGDVVAPMRVVNVGGETDQPRMVLAISGDGPARLDRDLYESHPRLKASVTAVNPGFAAVLAPLPGGTLEPEIEFARPDGAVIVTVRWPGREDTITWDGQGTESPSVSLRPR